MFLDELATGVMPRKLRIAGRPRSGKYETYVLLEEPGEPVQMHWKERLVPHFRKDCPNCGSSIEELKPLWYVGATLFALWEPVIVELTDRCFESLRSSERSYGPYTGMIIKILRADFERSPRVLRCEQRIHSACPEWPYRTREELARIWGIRVKPRLYQQDTG